MLLPATLGGIATYSNSLSLISKSCKCRVFVVGTPFKAWVAGSNPAALTKSSKCFAGAVQTMRPMTGNSSRGAFVLFRTRFFGAMAYFFCCVTSDSACSQLSTSCPSRPPCQHSLAEKPKVGELQMDWLRSEDLKEEKDVTAPSVITAVHALRRLQQAAGHTE